ncbi:MAG: acetate--CoA ligase family protein [Beijerinckiaceae bacterium]
MDFEAAREKVRALTHPRNVVLVGASDRPGSWAARVWRNLNRYAFPGNIHLFNPGRDEVFDKTCYRTFDDMPEPPDHLIVLVPAQHVPDLLRAGAAAGARSATVFSSGFGEAYDTKAEALGVDLRKAIAETGIGVSGPNCMGNICGPSSFVTLTEDRPLAPGNGPVALVGQSGGVMIFTNQALGERGIKAGYLITSGNEAGLSAADYIAYFAAEPEIKVIIVYIEALKDIERFKAACKDARARGKHVVAIKLGASEAGRGAAMAHTGSLAGTLEAFDALAADIGVVRAETLDEAVEITELLVHTGPAPGTRLGAITLSGAYRGLLLDAAEKHGLQFPPLQQGTLDRLNETLGVGSLVSNPIDGGFGVLTSADNFINSIKALEADPNIDMLLLQESLPREPGSDRAEKYIALVEDYVRNTAKKPVSFITPITHSQTDYSRNLRNSARHVSFLQEANRALRAIAATARSGERAAMAAASSPRPTAEQKQLAGALNIHARGAKSPVALNEYQSKQYLRVWGVPFAPEALAKTPKAAAAAAKRIGYPVVLKAVSSTLTHKSDAGAVMLNIKSEKALASAWQRIRDNVKAYCAARGEQHRIEGMIAAKQVSGGLELVLGLHRDPEAGLVLMVGMGGVWLELIKDVAFGVPPLTRQKAQAMLDSTRAGVLLKGYRGGPEYDVDAVLDAMQALGAFAAHAGSNIESVDLNPFAVLPKGQGAFALDALVVVRRK